jgi:hypothetical protein
MGVSWRYRIAPHDVATWPKRSIFRVLAFGEIVKEQMDEALDQ